MPLTRKIKEGYLAGEISDFEIISHHHSLRKTDVKSHGAVYTPTWIVDAIIQRLRLISPQQRLIEPACGHGSFALPLIRHAQKTLNLTWAETHHWFISQVTCVDIDPNVVEQLRTIVALLFRKEGVRSMPTDFTNITAGDGLKFPISGYDIAFGNPPYIRNRIIDPGYRQWLRANFEATSIGNIDIYYAFLDRYMTQVERCVFIVPNGCLKATSAKILRRRVFPILEEIVDFQSELVFPNARTYTCILLSEKGHKGPCMMRSSVDGDYVLANWQSLTGDEIHSAVRVAKSGLATLADKIFFLKQDPKTGEFIASADGRLFSIEKEILRPVFKISKSFSLDSPDKFAIFPYRSMNGRTPINEDEMREKFPNCHAYLCACRQTLEARDGGKASTYPIWYAYGRSQGLHDLSDKIIVFVPRIVGGGAIPRQFDTTRVTAKYGSPLFVSGFAIETDAKNRARLMSPEFRKYVAENGNPKPGKGETFYAISSKHVNSFLATDRV